MATDPDGAASSLTLPVYCFSRRASVRGWGGGAAGNQNERKTAPHSGYGGPCILYCAVYSEVVRVWVAGGAREGW